MATRTKRISARLSSVVWAALVPLLCLSMLLATSRTVYAVPARNPESLPEGVDPSCRSKTFDLLTLDKLSSDSGDGLLGAPGDEADATKSIPLVMVVVGFDNLEYDDTRDWGQIIFEGDRSLTQYYLDMSLGKFTFLPATESSATGVGDNTNEFDQPNDGIIHVKLDYEKTYGWVIHDNYDPEGDPEMVACFLEALADADEYIDFSAYDTDGDGTIQTSELALGFVVAGKDAATIYSIPASQEYQYTWPHAYSISEYHEIYETPDPPTLDGTVVDDYIAITEYAFDDYGRPCEEGLGTLAHELGHYIGLPDLYDTTGRSSYYAWGEYDVSYMSLMNLGGYGSDLEGNPVPFSLDIWSRIRLGWVDVVEFSPRDTDPYEIAGSLTSGEEAPIAYKMEGWNEGEYYLFENRRFTSWDEGMANIYDYCAYPDDSGGDYGGGIVVWHIDDSVVERFMKSNGVNDAYHHPGVVPIYPEEDENEEISTIGGASVCWNYPCYDSEFWPITLPLPAYSEESIYDDPDTRWLSSVLVMSFDSPSAPVMTFHRHSLYARTTWADDYSEAYYGGTCYVENEDVVLEVSTDITTEVVQKPSSTEPGWMAYTVHFVMDDWTSSTYVEIPPLDKETISARTEALRGLSELIIGAHTAMATGAYTTESFEALEAVIDEISAIFGDDTAVADDVAAAQDALLEQWRLLEPIDTAAQAEEAARREAALDLAERLNEVYKKIDPEEYQPAAYAAFAEVLDAAYDVLCDENATSKQLHDAEVAVARAETTLNRNGKRVSIAGATIGGLDEMIYTGQALEPVPTVALGGVELVAGTDYTVAYADNVGPGTATVSVTGIGDYTGTVTATFEIHKISLEAATISGLEAMEYTGSALEPTPTVTLGDVVLEVGTDYTITYTHNTDEGTATVTVTGKGVYDGTATATFDIVPSRWVRLAGANAVETMREIVRADGVFTARTVSTVVVAGRRDFRGALAGTALAGLYGAPLVTTDGKAGSLSAPALDELQRLAPSRVIVVGEASAVPESHVKGIKAALPKAKVERVSGKGASATAVAVATAGKSAPARWGKTCIVATPASYKDAMSIAPYAYARQAPIFFTESKKVGDGKGLSSAAAKAIKSGGYTRVLIVGGELAVPKSVESQLKGISCQRLSGANAIGTCEAVARFELDEGMGRSHLAVATTRDYADALAGAALAGAQDSVLVLVDPDGGLDAFDAVYSAEELVGGHILGGPASVSEANATYIRER